ncbi:hypothetical protein TRIUR3_08061 [Triticum urartu]|uniref:Uncharacterized protein n=1 Tax=Triticum urartu TaxID=4572 RepID=M7ZTW1_TRIUA|nr:hypothetical protein TRIUR3_08061 [Triticum urartu]
MAATEAGPESRARAALDSSGRGGRSRAAREQRSTTVAVEASPALEVLELACDDFQI